MTAAEMRSKSANWGGSGTAGALYLCSSQTTMLSDAFNPKLVWDQSVLVHELTHHAQCVSGRSMANYCEIEREAYNLQFKYLDQRATQNRDQLVAIRKRFDDIVARHCRR